MENYYEILEIDELSSERDIKKAYAKKLKEFPPEKFKNEFQLINSCYSILINSKERKDYNYKLNYNLYLKAKKNKDYILAKEKLEKAIDSGEKRIPLDYLNLLELTYLNRDLLEIKNIKMKFQETLKKDEILFLNNKFVEIFKSFIKLEKFKEITDFVQLWIEILEKFEFKDLKFKYDLMSNQTKEILKFYNDKELSAGIKKITLNRITKEILSLNFQGYDMELKSFSKKNFNCFLEDSEKIMKNHNFIYYAIELDKNRYEIINEVIKSIEENNNNYKKKKILVNNEQ